MTGCVQRLSRGCLLVTALCALSAGPVFTREQEPQGRGQPAPGAAGRGGGRAGQDPRDNVGPSDRPRVDQAAVARGRPLYNAECAACHGPEARGASGGPSLLRSPVVFEDRNGSRLGPFFTAGHPMQSGRQSSTLSPEDINGLLHFLLQQRNDSLRGSARFNVQDILVGDPAAGRAFFEGAGGCTKCHSTTGDLAGLTSRLPEPVDVQQRMLFPSGRGGGRGRGAAGPSRTAVTVTVTPASGEAISGVLVEMDDFFVTLRTPAGQLRVLRRTPALRVAVTDPLQAHHELLDRLTDTNMHDLTAFLWSLK